MVKGEKREILSRLIRVWIMFSIVVTGSICYFIFPEQGLYMLLSSCGIAFSYYMMLCRRTWQWQEAFIFLSVTAMTVYACIFPEQWNGFLFLAPLGYWFYALGKTLHIGKTYKEAWIDLFCTPKKTGLSKK